MEFFLDSFLGKPIWMWLTFVSIVVFLVAFDLGFLNKGEREISVKESLKLSAFYITIAFIFGGWVWYSLGEQSGEEYLTGFLVEKSLAIDNIFIISLVFTYFKIPKIYQHRVLFWGIIGVIILRAIMIGLGATLVAKFGWVLDIFAAFLVFTGIKMLLMADSEPDIANNKILKFLKKNFRISDKLEGNKFTVKLPDPKTGRLVTYVTPLLASLVLIEFVDLIFAVDSIPAIFTITLDPYIVYTSNIFAILGLRALFFALSAILHRFEYLKQALAVLLIFIGSKNFVADFMDWQKFPASVSLGITCAILGAGIVFSLYKTRKGRN